MLFFQFSKVVKALLIASAILLLSAGCAWGPGSKIKDEGLAQRVQIQVSHKVEGVDTASQQLNFYTDENKTGLDLLKSSHQVETKNFGSAGEYIVSIDGKKEDTGKNFWALYVNNKQSEVGASQYKPADGDKIEWKLEDIKKSY